MLGEHLGTIALGLIGLLFGSGINLLFPYLIQLGINGELGISLIENLGFFTASLIALFALQACFFCIRHFCFQVVGLRVVTKVRKTLFSALLKQDVSFFDTARVGDLLSRISSDTEILQRALTINISVGIRYLIQVIGGLALLLYISAKLTLVILAIIPLLMLASLFWSKRLRALSREVQAELGEASVVAEEAISSIRTVRIFSAQLRESERFASVANAALKTGTQRTMVAATFSSSMVFLLHTAIALVIWFGSSLVLTEQLSIGDFTGFLLYVVLVAVSFGFLVSTWVEFVSAAGATERIFDILDMEPKIVSAVDCKELTDSTANIVEFSEVSFSYATRLAAPILNNLSFSIAQGETIALVGPSGAGKSTIASLILRFYDPQSGVISFMGQPLDSVNLNDLRQKIAIVPQQPQVFSISLLENIRYSRPEASEQEARKAAEDACLGEFIDGLPEGFHTLVGDKGIQLSGGERQRIAIARALLVDPKLLILDEATSALDSNNEQLVQKALMTLMKDRSALIIAHRLSTIQHTDRVLVLKDGMIEQIGTHQELMLAPGLYQSLVQHQLLT
ncbi:UNVERIFIED_CONTAM: hypothetical protein GTU68_010383 [Idotea baltica]|nr:hypothetical protein [Idotea baltica]